MGWTRFTKHPKLLSMELSDPPKTLAALRAEPWPRSFAKRRGLRTARIRPQPRPAKRWRLRLGRVVATLVTLVAAPIASPTIILLLTVSATAPVQAGWSFRHEPGTEPPYPWGPEILPTDHRIYRDVERLAVRGELPISAWTLRPMSRLELAWAGRDLEAGPQSATRFQRDLARELEELGATPPTHETPPLLELLSGQTRLRFRPYIHVTPRLTSNLSDGGSDWDWSDSTRAGLVGALYLGRNVAVTGDVFAGEVKDGRRFSDPLFSGTDILVYSERFDVNIRTPIADFRFGRDRQRWGAGAWGNLILDNASAPVTFGQYDVTLGPWFRFRAMTGILNSGRGLYVAAHRFTWTPSRKLELSFTEGARYQADQPSLLYAMGFIPYTLVERIEMQDSLDDSTRFNRRNNVLVSLGWVWRTADNQAFYGEILADDISSEDSTTPSRWGFLGGYVLAPRVNGWDWTLGIEGAKVYNYTYSVYYSDQCDCDWEHQGVGLGFPDGPDSERLLLRALADVTPAWGGDLIITAFRHGQGDIGRPWYPSRFPESEGQPTDAANLWSPVTYGGEIQAAVRFEPRDNVGTALGVAFGRKDTTQDAHAAKSFLRLRWSLRVNL